MSKKRKTHPKVTWVYLFLKIAFKDVSGFTANKWRTLFVQDDRATPEPLVHAKGAHENPERREHCKCECRPVNESRAVNILMGKDREERPSYCKASRKVALRAGESIRGRSRLEEEQTKEYENLGPDTGWYMKRIDAECFKRSDDNENGSPPMIKGERQVDQDFVADVSRCVELLHDVVDVGDSTAY